ncbi:MAG TPA: carboxypeptidase regulatory-like domain-containing protein [Terriglobia bacterium]|nr:carboxypeptidase regulatory-like domain-containing protein [Terriglobia bacterium]
MSFHRILCLVLVSCFVQPATAWSQAETGNIVGIVTDISGAVLPGVAIEAASPTLIEKVRTTVTDEQGRYRIGDLRPGTYTVTFTLPGFSTLKRESLELTTGFTATVNAELKVGAIDETITVSEQAPMVDVQNIQQQVTITQLTLDALPTPKRPAQMITLIPSANAGGTNFHDVGGVGSDRGFFGVHGQRPDDMTYNVSGMDNRVFSGGGFQYNSHTFQEVVVETASSSAESTTGGVQINIIPKDGGNTFSGTASIEVTGPGLASDNMNDELRARGLKGAPSVRKYYDVGGGIGGPIKKDKLWFFAAFRREDRSIYQVGNYYNKLQGTLFYEPDLSRRAYNRDYSTDYSVRFTWQAAAKHKMNFSHSQHPACQCIFALLEQVSPVFAPEATAGHHYGPQNLSVFNYTYTATSHLLFEADFGSSQYWRNQKRQPEVSVNDISVTDLGLNLTYGSRRTGYQTLNDLRFHERFGLSYLSGTHNLKIGSDLNQFSQGRKDYNNPDYVNRAVSYTFRDRVPQSVTIYTGPWGPYQKATENNLYAQDQWTIVRRLTLNLGLRYTVYDAFIPAQHLPAGPWVPVRDYPEVEHSPHWQNFNPRLGVAFDLFGDGKTAVKASLGRYSYRNVGVAVDLPVANAAQSTTRSWTDANSNYIPDCDLKDPLPNGECGKWSDLTFGQNVPGSTHRAEDALRGFNKQSYNWQGSISVQRQLASNMSLNVGYFRTSYGGFLAIDNTLTTAADYDTYCITAPVDSRLPSNVSGKQFCGNADIKPAKFGQVDNLITQSSHYGHLSDVWDGFDVIYNLRFGRRGNFQGTFSTGREVIDNCLTIDSPATLLAGLPPTGGGNTNLLPPTVDNRKGFCHVSQPWSGGTAFGFNAVYPLPKDIQVSAIYQNKPGFPIRASYVVSDAEVGRSLGRHLSTCPSQTAATCTQTATIDLIPNNTLYGERIKQLDLRFSRIFRWGETRKLQANFDVYNIFNNSTVLNEQTRYSLQNNQWRNAIQIMGGRLVKLGGQFNF